MQENEFEKKLQQKMGELQVQPAEELWQKIKTAVEKKSTRRKRIVFFFFLFSFLIAGLFIADTSKLFNKNQTVAAKQTGNTGSIQQQKPVAANQSATLPSNVNAAQAVTSNGQNANLQSSVVVTKNKSLTVSANNNTRDADTRQEDMAAWENNHHYKKIKGKTKAAVRSTVTSVLPEEVKADQEENAINKPSQKVAVAAASIPTEINNLKKSEDEKKNKEVDVTVKKVPGKDSLQEEKKEAVQKNKPAEKDKNKQWGISISVTAGIAAAGNNYNSTNKSLAADYTGVTPGTSTGSPGNLLILPSLTRPGYGLSAGIQVFRQLSSKSKIISGLRYQLLTTSIKTGARSDSAAYLGSVRENIYHYGNTNSYRNYHHLISIPIYFSTKVFSIGQHEVNLDAGIDFSRLISTNTLQYSLAQAQYYKNNQLLNKTIVGLSVAAGINLSSKNKMPFSIGPEFYYSLTPLASAGMYAKSHYKFFGIKLQRNLRK
jgi:hypothetical protein